MFDAFKRMPGSVSVNLAIEIYGVLSTSTAKDALDIMRETKAALRLKVNEEAARITKSIPGFLTMHVDVDMPDLNYDQVLEILRQLAKDGKVRESLEKGLPHFIRI